MGVKSKLIQFFIPIVIKHYKEMQNETGKLTGMDQRTPSRAQYFSWINNTNEGSTEAQTLINLDFFKWLYDEYGMHLDIYAFDAGNIDGPGFYGSDKSFKFHQQFPNGFKPIADKAKSFECKLGLWGGPDGFGTTPEEEQTRTEMMVSLCRDYEFSLFKFDGVCGGLRAEKRDAFINMMQLCRKYSPDLIALNHRLDFGKAFPYLTTYLMGGDETYIDVFMTNEFCATHHRARAMDRDIPIELKRLTEDHGVCISSCVDFWDDDLILQAFNRCLILAPEIYGNPWFMKDSEFPKLARIYNLHRKYRDILVDGMVLPEDQYGPKAISRGDGVTRFITLRNLTWNSVQYQISLDESIGLNKGAIDESKDPEEKMHQKIHVRRFHPLERIIGEFNWGDQVNIDVPSFRSSLIMVSQTVPDDIGILGCDFDVIRDIPNKPILIHAYGEPGSKAEISVQSASAKVNSININGKSVSVPYSIQFSGTPLIHPWHRKLVDLQSIAVPSDAEAIYEATCFAADNNALEVRSNAQAGLSSINQVQKAREAFLTQAMFIKKGVWDKFAFDGDYSTNFKTVERNKVNGGMFRIDFGELIELDRIIIYGNDLYLDTKNHFNNALRVEVSPDLKTWKQVIFRLTTELYIELGESGVSTPIRYLRILNCADAISEVEGYKGDKKVDRTKWRASNLFGPYHKAPAVKSWSASFVLDEIPINSYLCVPIHGIHGKEGVYVGFRIDGMLYGAPDRAPSFPSNVWEHYNKQVLMGYTYYLPLTQKMVGKRIEVVALELKGHKLLKIKPEVWISAHPEPFEKIEIVINRKS